MKQKVTRIALTLLLSVLTAATAWADDPTWLRPGDSWDATTSTLTVNTETVAQSAYWYNNVIENVIISNSVTSIGANAFFGCTNLKTVFVSNDVTSIGDGAFYNCTNLKTVFVGNGVTGIGSSAFENCTSLTSINIPASVTSIGASAFAGCTNLKTVFVGNGVTSIGDGVFYNCTNLKTVIMTRTSSAPILGHDMFFNTPNLKIYVPVNNYGNILPAYQQGDWYNYYKNNYLIGSWSSGTCAAGLNDGVLTVVGFGAFENCIGDNSRPNINSIVIKEGVTSIGEYAFSGCGNLATITVDANNQTFDSPEGSNAIIRKTDNALVLGCKTTVIPASVTSIGASAFSGCSGLTTISIPDGVTSIGTSAFSGCSGLTTVSIPDGVQSIGYSAFLGCANLESVNIGSGVTSIAKSAFNDCDKLATITVDTGNQTFDSREGCNAIIRKTDNALVAGCKTTVIPNSVTSIGDQAFWGNDGLTSITIPASVTRIGISAFCWCSGLTSITIPNSVTRIGYSAFNSCSNLASVTLNGVATIGENAFETYAPLTTVTIAEGLILYNGTELLSGAITDMSKLNGKTLQRCYSITLPDHVTASGTAGVLNNIIYALPGATVTLSITPRTGYEIGTVTYNDGTDHTIISIVASYSFTMPASDVTVAVTWKKLLSNSDITVLPIADQVYTGSPISPKVTVMDGETDISGQCIFVIMGNTTNTGTVTVTITANPQSAGYAGATTTTFRIIPKETNLGAVTLVEDQTGVTAVFDGSSTESIVITEDIEVNSVTYNRTFTPGKPSTLMLPFDYTCNGSEGGKFYRFVGVEKEGNTWVATMKETGDDANNMGTIEANTPYLVMPTEESLTFTGGATLNTTGGGNCLASDAEGWEFHGTYEKKVWDEAVTHDYGFAATSGTSADNQDVEAGQFVRLTHGASAKPMRCYLSYVGGPAQARSLTRGAAATDEELPSSIIVRLVGSNGETTAIGTIDTKTGEMTFDSEAWYTLDGVRLSGKPTKKGLYINNGRKVVIK